MALKRLRNSLTVNIITPFGVGLVSLSGAAGLGRQARRWRQRAGSADGDRRSRTASVSCRGRGNSCCGPTELAAPSVQRWSGNACGPTQQPGRTRVDRSPRNSGCHRSAPLPGPLSPHLAAQKREHQHTRSAVGDVLHTLVRAVEAGRKRISPPADRAAQRSRAGCC